MTPRKNKNETRVVAEINRGAIGPGESDMWEGVVMRVPAVPPTNLAGMYLLDRHTVILEYFNIKNKHFQILPSSLSKYSLAPNTNRIFQMLWCVFEGRTNRARPSQPFLKNCQNGTF